MADRRKNLFISLSIQLILVSFILIAVADAGGRPWWLGTPNCNKRFYPGSTDISIYSEYHTIVFCFMIYVRATGEAWCEK